MAVTLFDVCRLRALYRDHECRLRSRLCRVGDPVEIAEIVSPRLVNRRRNTAFSLSKR